MVCRFIVFKILAFCFVWSPTMASNIGAAFLRDKNFEQQFVSQYGQVYYIIRNQIQAWVDVLGYKTVTLKDLEIIATMAIPRSQKKKFFRILEAIILKIPSNDKNIKHQLMLKIYGRYKKFYNHKSMIWHLKYLQKTPKDSTINQVDSNYESINDEKFLKKLAHHLIYQTVLNPEDIDFFQQQKILFSEPINWTTIVYGLILKYLYNQEKLGNLDHYPLTAHQKKFLNFIKKKHQGSLSQILNQYKASTAPHPHQSHEILILLIKYILDNRKNQSISNKEWIHIFKIIVSYYPLIFSDFNGVGIGNFFKAIKLLIYKQIAEGLIINSNTSLKNFLNYIQNNQAKVIKYCQQEFVNPYFKYPMETLEINHEKDQLTMDIYRKNYSKKKGYIVEFFGVFNIVNIIYKKFFVVMRWAPFNYFLSKGAHQYHHEQSVYFIILSAIELIAFHGKKPEENEILLLFLKEKIDFWTEKIKHAGQVSVYGQLIADKFLSKYRNSSYFGLYLNNLYNKIYTNTIKNKINMDPDIQGKDWGKNITKHDWFIMLGIYVLNQEKIHINVEEEVMLNNKSYKKIINNKYSISRTSLYQWDYIVKHLSYKSLTNLTLMGQILAIMSMKKYRYMIMLNEALENKTGVSSSFGIHPKLDFLKNYNDKLLDLGLLSALTRKETGCTLLVDGMPNQLFNAAQGSGLFQVNFANAQWVSKKFNIGFSERQLKYDIQYNFFVVIHFLQKLKDWLRNKNIITWIISYNAPMRFVKMFQQLISLYNIPNHNQEIRILYSPFVINLIPNYITRNYAIHVLSFWGNNNFFLEEDYDNLFNINSNHW
jgi:hypothetical protein